MFGTSVILTTPFIADLELPKPGEQDSDKNEAEEIGDDPSEEKNEEKKEAAGST